MHLSVNRLVPWSRLRKGHYTSPCTHTHMRSSSASLSSRAQLNTSKDHLLQSISWSQKPQIILCLTPLSLWSLYENIISETSALMGYVVLTRWVTISCSSQHDICAKWLSNSWLTKKYSIVRYFLYCTAADAYMDLLKKKTNLLKLQRQFSKSFHISVEIIKT